MSARQNFQIGDRVFTFESGNGIVSEIKAREENYSVIVNFDLLAREESFTTDGKRIKAGNRTLFFGNMPPLEIPQEWLETEDLPDLRDLATDDKIMVWFPHEQVWLRKRFAGINKAGQCLFFATGDSWTNGNMRECIAEKWRLPSPDEL